MSRVLLFVTLAACGSNSLTIAMVQQNNSGQDGTATLTDTAEGVAIEVRVRESSFAGAQTSHVHEGRCDNVGRIFAGISMKTDPASADGGYVVFGAMKVPGTLSQLRDGNHVINVHDARDNSLYVSCGEID